MEKKTFFDRNFWRYDPLKMSHFFGKNEKFDTISSTKPMVTQNDKKNFFPKELQYVFIGYKYDYDDTFSHKNIYFSF